MPARFTPTNDERDNIIKIIHEKRKQRGKHPLCRKTEAKIVSLYHHIKKTIDKPDSDISTDDLIKFYKDSKYSPKTLGWANSILATYFDFKVPNISDVCDPITQVTIGAGIISDAMNLMYEAINQGSGHVASFITVLVMLLTCHKCSDVLQLTVDDVRELVENGGIDRGNVAFVILDHLNDFKVANKTLLNHLKDILPNAASSRPLENSSSFISLGTGSNFGYADLYKFSRDALRARLGQNEKQFFGQDILDLERLGFKDTMHDYVKWLISQLQSSEQ